MSSNCLADYFPLYQEPVQDENDIIKFCEESGLPVALDETIGNIQENTLEKVAKYAHPGIVAVVSDSEFFIIISLCWRLVSCFSLMMKLHRNIPVYLLHSNEIDTPSMLLRINGNSTQLGLSMGSFISEVFLD